ncbi:MAG: (Fe-S)-binding protein [Phycisphaeraceae bacterium]|nr:(Fe-S)-binding protein [Phycisphaeraceae bacterium]
MRVALFVTCLTESFYPRTAVAVVRVLEKLGCTVRFPREQTCCGQPMYNNGFHHDARDLARRMVRVFADDEYVVTPSGSCCAMVRCEYPHLFEHHPAELAQVQKLADKTYEFMEFLLRVLKVDLRQLNVQWPGKVTAHEACHLRGLNMQGQADQLMDQITGLEHVRLNHRDQCCGFGGTFALKFPEVSGPLVEDKVAAIRQSAADTVIVNDAGCALNISGACHRAGCHVKFKSLAEIIAEGMGLMEREQVSRGGRQERGEMHDE